VGNGGILIFRPTLIVQIFLGHYIVPRGYDAKGAENIAKAVLSFEPEGKIILFDGDAVLGLVRSAS